VTINLPGGEHNQSSSSHVSSYIPISTSMQREELKDPENSTQSEHEPTQKQVKGEN